LRSGVERLDVTVPNLIASSRAWKASSHKEELGWMGGSLHNPGGRIRTNENRLCDVKLLDDKGSQAVILADLFAK
jgi:hypothetical protein